MPAKLITTILAGASVAGGLLVIRQHRLDTAHDMSRSHLRLVQHEQALWRLKTLISQRLSNDNVQIMAARYSERTGVELVPFMLEDCLRRCVVPPDPDLDPADTQLPEADLTANDIGDDHELFQDGHSTRRIADGEAG